MVYSHYSAYTELVIITIQYILRLQKYITAQIKKLIFDSFLHLLIIKQCLFQIY